MIGLTYALTTEVWEYSQTRDALLRVGNGAINTILGTAAAFGLLSMGLAMALPKRG